MSGTGIPQTSTSATSLLSHVEGGGASHKSFAQKFSLSPSPHDWGTPLLPSLPEPDDALHNPDPVRDRKYDAGGTILTKRGLANLGCLGVLAGGVVMMFAGYPLLAHFLASSPSTHGGFNVGGINASGQIPSFPASAHYSLIDPDTPTSAYSKKSWVGEGKGGAGSKEDMVLVFSDEFNVEGRSFYPGDDPFWEGVDLHYWGTNDLEWYDPSQPTTKTGALHLSLEQFSPADNHDLSYRSGMVQSWNKFCFTGGLVEVAVTLPGTNSVAGFWPAVWAMGNLGRAGFGGSLDGMWPYSYDTCDVGTLPNQTYVDRPTEPAAALSGGDAANGGVLSYLPGQRLSACTCPGESHPGPMRADGSYVGRSAPEIDVFEALIGADGGQVSLSAQWAPYNAGYNWANTSANVEWYGETVLNEYKGGVYQQTTSGLASTNPECYELTKGCYTVYGFEYRPGFDENPYITWINDGKQAWTLFGDGMGPDDDTKIGRRVVPVEPMYLIANLGFSHNFANIDFDKLTFPATMSIDYIRVYQPKDKVNVGCNPEKYPTSAYIETFKDLYTNPNISTWSQTGQPWPRNRMETGSC